MTKLEMSGARLWLIVAGVGVTVVGLVSLNGTPWQAAEHLVKIERVEVEKTPGESVQPPLDAEIPAKALRRGTAMRYALAVQQGNTEEVIRMTKWMQDRLEYVSRTTGDPEAVAQARRVLRTDLAERRIEENQLGRGGVEDKYVFSPGTQLTPLGTDKGEENLESGTKTKCRTWIRVTYPDKQRALKDETGAPIRALEVGVTESIHGQILKAGIEGNLDIDLDSFSYDWASTQGDDKNGVR